MARPTRAVAGEGLPRILSLQPGYTAHALRLLGDIATQLDRFDAESGEAQSCQALALGRPRWQAR